MVKKHSMLFISFSLVVLLLSGCVEGIYHVTVNKDGSGDVDIKIAMNPMILGLAAEDGEDPMEEMKKGPEEEGFTVSNYKSGDLVGIQAEKHYESISDFEGFDNLFEQEGSPSIEAPIRTEKNFFQTTYILDNNVDFTDMAADEDIEFQEMGNAMLSSLDFQFLLTLPIEPEDHNAGEVIDDGKTLKWQLMPGEENNVYLKATTWNIANIVYLLLGVAAVVILGIIGFRRLSK